VFADSTYHFQGDHAHILEKLLFEGLIRCSNSSSSVLFSSGYFSNMLGTRIYSDATFGVLVLKNLPAVKN